MDQLPACCDDPELWDAARPKHEQRYAVRVCQQCPFRKSCRDLANSNPPKGLIQAGLLWDKNGLPHVIPA